MKILIIGSSAAGIEAAAMISSSDRTHEVTIVSEEAVLPYYRFKLAEFIFIKEAGNGFYFKDKEFFEKNNLKLLLNKKAIGLDTRKRRVRLDDNTYIDFDRLLVATGANCVLPQIKGTNKKNVYGLRSYSDAEEIKKNLPIASTVFLTGNEMYLRDMALKLSLQKKEVFLVTTNNNLVADIEENENLRFMLEDEILEIIGESQIQAVKLKSNKVMACSLLVYNGNFKSNINFLKGSPVELSDGVIVDENMRTNLDFIFAAGDVVVIDETRKRTWDNAIEQGRKAGLSILL
ncbi:MAG: NAD(P)/FAD-dependent oxidoreductase [Candidatus Gygaella obscura]|nr:NAD(P)/FAD-dependent oxidoreductase [Candidatus Gygaella obscura]